MEKQTIAIPNDLVDKYASLFQTTEQWQAVLDLIKQSYNFGYDKGSSDEYIKIMGDN